MNRNIRLELCKLKASPKIASKIRTYLVALIELPARRRGIVTVSFKASNRAVIARRANQHPSGRNLSSPLPKNIPPSAVGQITGLTLHVSPTEGRIASRHGRGMRCGGRSSVGAKGNRRAASAVSD
jgi:hypothetical protein